MLKSFVSDGARQRQLLAAVGVLLGAASGPLAVAQPPEYHLLFYLSANDPGPLPPIPNPAPPNYTDLGTPPEFTLQHNPLLTTASRLWLWANPLTDPVNCWAGITLSIDADGPLALSNLTLFNPNYFFPDGSYPRWDAARFLPLSPDHSEYPEVEMYAVDDGYAVCWPPLSDGYADGATGNMLLGYFDVTYSGMGLGTVWLEIGLDGIYRAHGPLDRQFIHFGFGDNPIDPDDLFARSALPEATFIPEPASGVLLLTCAALIARRRRAAAAGGATPVR